MNATIRVTIVTGIVACRVMADRATTTAPPLRSSLSLLSQLGVTWARDKEPRPYCRGGEWAAGELPLPSLLTNTSLRGATVRSRLLNASATRVGSVAAPFGPSPYQSAHHSHTLPCMSHKPQAFACFVPTGWILLSLLFECQANLSKSPANRPVVPPRQAHSHCASVGSVHRHPAGNRPFAFSFRQNSDAVSQLTVSTGSSLPLKLLGLLPDTASHCACVTSVRPSQNDLVSVTWWGVSSGARASHSHCFCRYWMAMFRD